MRPPAALDRPAAARGAADAPLPAPVAGLALLAGLTLLAALALLAAPAPVPAQSPFDVPLDPRSPWPKFRRDSAQTGRAPQAPMPRGGRRWTVRTGSGIFSSPVIGADGTVYVGSADRRFYAVSPSGRVRWRFATGEIIDSAALLDDRGRVYVPSGDGHVYALDARTGAERWRFAAAPPETTGAFINWFEGNVAIGLDGTLYAPNDNFRTYALDRDTGRERWAFATRDQTWSLPAVDAATGELFMGNNYFLGGAPNVFSIAGGDGAQRWAADVQGSVVASPLLTRGGLVVVGGFDGYVHAFDRATGARRWTFPTRNHIYASAAEQADGTIVVPSTDGTIYALDPATGRERWRYDTLNPIRSSPAVDGRGSVYVGTGDGRVLVANRHGGRRWALRVTSDPRATLNASPALGRNAVAAADSEGSIVNVPLEYCLRPAQRRTRGCARGGDEGLRADGARLYWTSPFGVLERRPPRAMSANRPVALSLVARRRGRTRLALIDPRGLRVRAHPPARLRVEVSGDRRYLIVAPRDRYRGGSVTLSVRGRYLVDPRRRGLAFSGGRPGGRFAERLRLALRAGTAGERLGARVWRLNRLALPLPDLLPSYNQIGFDRLEFLVSVVERLGRGRALVWMVGARPGRGGVVADPGTSYRVAFTARLRDGLLELQDAGRSSVNLNGFDIETASWRLAGRLGRGGRPQGDPITTLQVDCGKIGFYGPFLEQLGLCAPGLPMEIYGAARLRRARDGLATAPSGVGDVAFAREGDELVARVAGSTLRADGHAFGLLAVDARGRPLPLPYGTGTRTAAAAADGTVSEVRVPAAGAGARAATAYLMVDAAVGARGAVTGPESLRP